VLLNSTEGL
jgi:hypothetical protein